MRPYAGYCHFDLYLIYKHILPVNVDRIIPLVTELKILQLQLTL